MGTETQKFINNLMLDIRDLVLGLQEEHSDLKEKVTNLPQSVTSTTVIASPVTVSDEPSTTPTVSTGTISTGNSNSTTRPPPYKSIIQPQYHSRPVTQNIPKPPPPPPAPSLPTVPLPPKVPIRTKRRSDTQTTTSATLRGINKIMPSEVARGAFIVLEGLDRVGKSTLAKRLVEHLERIRRPVTHCRFPDRETPIGKVINEVLIDKDGSKRIDDHSMHLLFSANRWEYNRRIRNALLKGTTVVADRYSYSGIAYSSAKRGLSIDWCREPERGLPKPDLVIYLELPREAQYRRAGFGDEKFETKEMQELVRGQYEQLMEMSQDTWLRINVEDKGPDEVLGEVIVPVKRCLEACVHKDIGDLDFL